MPPMPIVHIEIAVKDAAAADKFYSEVFGWTVEVDPRFNYHQFKAEGGPAGAFLETDGNMYRPGDIVLYLATENIDATLMQVVEKGGKVVQARTEIPGVGWFALFADPAGNRLGLFGK